MIYQFSLSTNRSNITEEFSILAIRSHEKAYQPKVRAKSEPVPRGISCNKLAK